MKTTQINKDMKKYIGLTICFLSILVFFGCQEEEKHHPYGADGSAPGKVIIDNIVNTPGGAIIFFSAPNDEDVLYVRANFEDDRGNKREVKASAVLDSLVVQGFGKVGDYTVGLYAVDRSENASEVSNANIAPLDPPVQSIFPTLTGVVDYGGVKVSYENISRAEISINITKYDETKDEYTYRESFFTSQSSGSYSFRGFKSESSKFGVYLEDKWGNLSETLYFDATPIPDEFLDKDKFSVFKIQGDKSFGEYGFSASQMWDKRWSDQWNCGHTNFEPLPHFLTIDLGTKVKLSRFKLYQRGGSELYKHGNPKHFKIYGALDINNLPPFDAADPTAGWTLLKECFSFKPSGLPIGQTTSEDYEYQNKGEDFEFDVDNLVEVRYIRIENIATWGEQIVSVIGELSFWGEITE